MDYTAIDARADALLREGVPPSQVWSALMSEFPDVHSNILAERLTAPRIDAELSIPE